MSEIRHDRLHDHYVLIAPERMRRPDTLSTKSSSILKHSCPFCEGHEKMTPPEIYAIRDNHANENGWHVRVIPNLYKVVQIELEDYSKIDGIFKSRPGLGAHEIIIDTPSHDCHLANLDSLQIGKWLSTIAIRIADLRHDKRLVHISVFKNHGENAGAIQSHPHTQIIALPVEPHNTLRLMEKDFQYYRRHGRGKVEDILENERNKELRIISQKGDFVAFCPFASSFPFEIMIAPTRALSTLDDLNRDDISHLTELIKEVFMRLDVQLGDFNYNLSFNMAPLNSNFENEPYFPHLKKYYRMTIRIMPRIYRLGGFELSTGMLINPVEPEEAAKLLNEVKLR